MHDPSSVRVSGPLQPYAAGFAAALAQFGYTPLSTIMQLRLLAHLSRWLQSEGLAPAGLSPAVVERFIAARRAAGYTHHASVRATRPIIEYLHRLGVVPPPAVREPATPLEGLLERYHRYLTIERSLAPTTARGYLDAVRPFLAGRVTPAGLDLADLTAADITTFVAVRCPTQAHGSARLTLTALRSLLGLLHLDGVLSRSLVAAVPRVASWRLAGLPRGLEPAEIRSVLETCDRRRATGCRDLAILTLLVRLGLRAGEVAGLGLDDIDWRAGELVISGKGQRRERLPLPADVGEVLVDYLRRGRPASAQGRTVFVRVKAPHRTLTSGGITQVVAAAGQRAGLGVLHAHRLRHTAATEMLRAGSSLVEIGQVLRHRRALTTAIYAKVDRRALRVLARPWPGGAA
ncbi:MAG: tyrosine-type recombinase/integrase [Thermoleophilaceae bacterium]